uniref:Uncharacterized protein n=1 Tax=Anguilla anguilla TaxID=7936 RepID=A0A0E9XPS6_ANGAN
MSKLVFVRDILQIMKKNTSVANNKQSSSSNHMLSWVDIL